jgi:hypothetical protein
MYAVSVRQPQAGAVPTSPVADGPPGRVADPRGPARGRRPAGRDGRPAYGALLGVMGLVDCVDSGAADFSAGRRLLGLAPSQRR